jgi:hypothetical protein
MVSHLTQEHAMLDILPENKDIYSARCLAHHLYGKPYHALSHKEVIGAVEELKRTRIPYEVLRNVWWPGGSEVMSTLYVVRNHAKYRGDTNAVLDHLICFDPPPKAAMARRRKERARINSMLHKAM